MFSETHPTLVISIGIRLLGVVVISSAMQFNFHNKESIYISINHIDRS